jgi:hypothetical protein
VTICFGKLWVYNGRMNVYDAQFLGCIEHTHSDDFKPYVVMFTFKYNHISRYAVDFNNLRFIEHKNMMLPEIIPVNPKQCRMIWELFESSSVRRRRVTYD